jgi:hypothetical protein
VDEDGRLRRRSKQLPLRTTARVTTKTTKQISEGASRCEIDYLIDPMSGCREPRIKYTTSHCEVQLICSLEYWLVSNGIAVFCTGQDRAGGSSAE